MKLQQETAVNTDAIKSWSETPEGWLKIDIPLCGPGVLVYDRNRGDAFTAKEYRSESELFNADSVATLIGKPVTVSRHPLGGVVNAKNYREVNAGTVVAARREGNELVATALVQDAQSIALLKQDKTLRGASAGYQCDEKRKERGTTEYGEHDTLQIGIRYNHITICRNPRYSNAKFNLDGREMTKTVEELEAENTALITERDGLQKEVGNLRGDLLKANKQIVNLDSKSSDEYERGLKDGQTQHKLTEHAKALGINVDSMDPKLIKLAVIKKANPDINTDSFSDEQVDAALMMAMAKPPQKEFKQQLRGSQPNNDSAQNGTEFDDYQSRLLGGGKGAK